MLVKVLGAAAGGAFPQWNCACQQCQRLRSGTFKGQPRSQAQIAISEDGAAWTLLNASPDIRSQIEATPCLWPDSKATQLHSPIQAVVITAAEADTVAGLLSLREFQPLDIYATASVLRILREDNSLFALLDRVPHQASWKEIQPDVEFSLGELDFQPFTLPGGFPGFVSPNRQSELVAGEAVLGLLIDSPSGGRMAYLPGVAKVEEFWREWLDECDLLLFDGTFWTEDELCRVRGGGKPASAMGHLALSGPCGSLAALSNLKCARKIFFHVNNTNPILDESSPAYAQVRDAGWEVARDGMEIRI
ncbi:MAG: pyrroloquinoline quinone biosynthesis protein PqqB [Bryobacteraceae bacterium]|jgi:pyrroloquinoline quinone biosynthesis protein B